MLKIHQVPSLRSPVLLCAFGGWSDAAYTASGALRYLSTKYSGRRIAEVDPDAVFNYTVTRPITAFAAPGQRVLRWPSLDWKALSVPEGKHDLVVVRGPEPDLRWRACAEECISFALQLQVTQVIALGAFYATVPYAGPPLLIGLSSDATLSLRLTMLGVRESAYEGPTGFVTAIVNRAREAGLPSAGVWAAAPSYMPGMGNPSLSSALLGVVEGLLGQSIDRADLDAAGREMETQIDEALRNRPDLAAFIRRLQGKPPESEAPAAREQVVSDSDELPSAEEVLRGLEEHLRRLREQPPEGTQSSDEQ